MLNMQEALAKVKCIGQVAGDALIKSFTMVTANKNRTLKKISFSSRRMTRKGLAARVVGQPQWREGSTRFSHRSRNIIWDSDYRVPSGERLINRLLALSIAITPVTFQHACMLLRVMWFKVPWSTGMYNFIHDKVHPAVEQIVEEQEAELVDRNRNCDVGFDACHNAVRSAQVSRAAMSLQNEGRDHGKIIKAITSAAGRAAGREDKMLRALIAWRKVVKLNILSVTTDESSGWAVCR
jgi:hypothetical protein